MKMPEQSKTHYIFLLRILLLAFFIRDDHFINFSACKYYFSRSCWNSRWYFQDFSSYCMCVVWFKFYVKLFQWCISHVEFLRHFDFSDPSNEIIRSTLAWFGWSIIFNWCYSPLWAPICMSLPALWDCFRILVYFLNWIDNNNMSYNCKKTGRNSPIFMESATKVNQKYFGLSWVDTKTNIL
jgi:hypothetical protein